MEELEKLASQYGYKVLFFSPEFWGRAGVIDHVKKIIFVNAMADPITIKKVIYHELGHKDHNPANYDRLREKYELQANKSMLQNLVAEELKNIELQDFNVLQFCQKYQLKESYYMDMLHSMLT